ncbi:MAG: hypothetical protein ABIG66_00055 [Candidatus Kerfeldbacteria bacterium]
MAIRDEQPEQTNKAESQFGKPINKGRILAQWDFPEYEKPERGTIWYICAFGIGGGLLIWAVADGNFLFALMVLLFAFIIFTHHRREAMKLHFTLYERGIQVGDRFYLFREISNFAIIYEPPHIKRLYFEPKSSVVRRTISIPLLDQDPVRIRELLLDYLQEDLKREQESGSDALGRMLKL